MRIRSIKPEFWRSEDIVSLPISARLTFIGIWSYVDDNGVGSAKLSSIVSDLYSDDLVRDPQETLRRVAGDIQALENRGMLARYFVNGREFLHVTKWEDHQVINRPSKGHLYPLPPADIEAQAETLMQTARDTPETLTAGAVELGAVEQLSMEPGKSEPQPNPPDRAKPPPVRVDVNELVAEMSRSLERRDAKVPDNLEPWRKQARLLLDNDKRDLAEALELIKWAETDKFWTSNVLSMAKFRDKYDSLRLQHKNRGPGSNSKSQIWNGIDSLS